ncbi:excinuclease ABC subunit UvrC [Campylobacter vulpis]|uniref:excinuclease ABC subunit UvrC n=1 Tax=Campylobacter vulpis TaxID=1655500 RepID=UPI000C15D4C3|nr:excinuclease ABC subunit UvrC [Campylobacter vulpis]MBS4275211.1 excinuclease ABC subunit UvrC [Campylobacter vulpis]MBS4306219.1 excinuclease ABC subunit UvrC [Campylobacter vulpis]MBS4329529.1 excinuclease ABC subunit UvrC [Campylobacter vulpis]MBS4422955.1 excinuclease ABC subunit UvrC [Campylobacter vulpis]PHY91763.1 excinuclease ABC subunit C [Campylobacter vulpis]
MLEKDLMSLPESAGIYQYFNQEGKLLYVGKAKNLKKRVKSYFSFNPLRANAKNSLRIQKMISEAAHLKFISTKTEANALILENSLIKQLHPKYNILLRDDKTYPYIYVDLSEKFPRFELTRKIIKKPKIKYYGPFFRGAKELLNALYLYYPLKQKKNCKKLCIFHQISRCGGVCENLISEENYKEILANATKALLNPSILIKNLEQAMLKYAHNENYEEAAKIRDEINAIKALETKVQIDLARLEDFEIFALAIKNGICSTLRFIIQEGKIISTHSKIHILKEKEIYTNEIYKQVLLENFSQDTPLVSNRIYTYEDFEDRELLEELLSERFAKKIRIQVPQKGEKRKICDLAFENALLNIEIHLKNNDLSLMEELKHYFELENLPHCIEIYDNSHLQGVAKVGAMVCFKNGKWEKQHYRKFHLQEASDYEQMKEVLIRRTKDFESFAPPDLWLIDGGKALLDLACSIIASSGANVDVLAIAKEKIDSKAHRSKGSARDKIHSKRGEFLLKTEDKKLQFLQKLRDEAHRFALSFHKNTKKKQDLKSSKLLNLGISEGYLQKLLAFYGDFESIYKANYEELKMLTNAKIAQKIKDTQ